MVRGGRTGDHRGGDHGVVEDPAPLFEAAVEVMMIKPCS
jgi:hypothetical protein